MSNFNIFETDLVSKVQDNKGRQIAYKVILREDDYGVLAKVQKAVKQGEDFIEWGATQAFKPFTELTEARDWAYKTAKERISKLA